MFIKSTRASVDEGSWIWTAVSSSSSPCSFHELIPLFNCVAAALTYSMLVFIFTVIVLFDGIYVEIPRPLSGLTVAFLTHSLNLVLCLFGYTVQSLEVNPHLPINQNWESFSCHDMDQSNQCIDILNWFPLWWTCALQRELKKTKHQNTV